MKIDKIKVSYRRNLPHVQLIGATFFVTFRLKDSIPKAKVWELKQSFEDRKLAIKREKPSLRKNLLNNERKRFFAQYDALLDAMKEGPTYLKIPGIAALVAKEIHRFDDELYKLIAYSIMPNHVHLLLDTSLQLTKDPANSQWESLDFEPLNNIMKRIKGPSAIYANRQLGLSGKFWQRESYDHYIRDGKELERVIGYILNNPVKAKLADRWENHPFSYFANS